MTLYITPTHAAPVYIAKDSRAYHCDHNCSDLNTNDLIEFASPQKADDAGAIPCKHCNSSDIIMADKDNQDKQNKGVSSDIQTEIKSNEDEYVGNLKDGVRHGHGTATYADGTKYVGGWKDGKMHGQGTYTWPSGNKYFGGWKNGKMHGQGTNTSPDDYKYVGGLKDGEYHGQGTETWPDGTKYVGELKDNKPHGQGTFTYANGDKYVGEWKDGKQHGQGTSISADGVKYVGEFKDHKPHGQGTITYANGDKYVGEWKYGKMHGQGTSVPTQGTKSTVKRLSRDQAKDVLKNSDSNLYIKDSTDKTAFDYNIPSEFLKENYNTKKHEYAPYYKQIKVKIRLYWLLQYGTDTSVNQVTSEGKPVIVTFKVLPSGIIVNVEVVDTAGNNVLASKIKKSIQNTKLNKFPDYIHEKFINVRFSWINGEKVSQKSFSQPVYSNKNSRIYHINRECTKLDTSNMFLFVSEENAKSVGTIECKLCSKNKLLSKSNEIKTYTPKGNGSTASLDGSKKQGQGTHIWPNGDKYVGEWKDGKMHGQGTQTLVNGIKYVGEYKEGKSHGQGTVIWSDGKKYEGEWKDDNYHGHGTLTWTNGYKYTGEFKNDKITGRGTMAWPSGDKHEGEWKDGKEHGTGTYTKASGSKYEGVWKMGKMHGRMTFTRIDGTKKIEMWKDGHPYNSRMDELTYNSLMFNRKFISSFKDKKEKAPKPSFNNLNPKFIIGKWEYEDGTVLEFCKNSSLYLSLLGSEIRDWYKIKGDVIEVRDSLNFSVAHTFYKILEVNDTTFKFIRTGTGGEKTTYNIKRKLPRYSPYYSSVVFDLLSCSNRGSRNSRSVKGEVPLSIDLSNKEIADQILADAIVFAEQACPVNSNHDTTAIKLFQIDKLYPEMNDAVISATTYNEHIRKPHWNHFTNNSVKYAKKKAEIVRKKRKAQEAVRLINDFYSKNKTEEHIKTSQLCTNPFVYEDKIISLYVSFYKMTSATRGLFTDSGDDIIVVSGIPKGLFQTKDKRILLVGKVLGNVKEELPYYGNKLIPHLKYIDSMVPAK